MPQDSRLTAFVSRNAFVSAASTLALVIGCAGSADDVPAGNGGRGGSGGSAGAPSAGSAGMTSSGGSTGNAGTTGGSSAGSGGSSAGSGGSATNGGSAGNPNSAGGGAGGTMGGAGGGGAGGATHGGAGGGGTGGGSGANCSSSKLCEDFEKDALDPATWTLPKGGQFMASIATDQAHSGTRSFHVAAPNVTGSAFLTHALNPPLSDFWGRAWLRFKGPQGGHQVYIYAAKGGDQLRLLNRKSGSEAIGVNVQSTDKWYLSKTLIPQETWFCYEWHVTKDSATFFKDGTQLSDITGVPGMDGPTSLALGYQRWQTGTAAGDIWIDDVAVNDKQVGCN